MKEIIKQIKSLNCGDLVRVDWFDASIGRSLSGCLGEIDVPVYSWGVFLGVLGEKNKHIILAQNSFRYTDSVYDIDYTAVPIAWANNVAVIAENHVKPEEAQSLLKSFLANPERSSKRKIKQQKVRNTHA
ncbi:MAG: hypothetical protein QXJ02_03270 [Candidatus Bathyarchaeia archaeon]